MASMRSWPCACGRPRGSRPAVAWQRRPAACEIIGIDEAAAATAAASRALDDFVVAVKAGQQWVDHGGRGRLRFRGAPPRRRRGWPAAPPPRAQRVARRPSWPRSRDDRPRGAAEPAHLRRDGCRRHGARHSQGTVIAVPSARGVGAARLDRPEQRSRLLGMGRVWIASKRHSSTPRRKPRIGGPDVELQRDRATRTAGAAEIGFERGGVSSRSPAPSAITHRRQGALRTTVRHRPRPDRRQHARTRASVRSASPGRAGRAGRRRRHQLPPTGD